MNPWRLHNVHLSTFQSPQRLKQTKWLGRITLTVCPDTHKPPIPVMKKKVEIVKYHFYYGFDTMPNAYNVSLGTSLSFSPVHPQRDPCTKQPCCFEKQTKQFPLMLPVFKQIATILRSNYLCPVAFCTNHLLLNHYTSFHSEIWQQALPVLKDFTSWRFPEETFIHQTDKCCTQNN